MQYILFRYTSNYVDLSASVRNSYNNTPTNDISVRTIDTKIIQKMDDFFVCKKIIVLQRCRGLLAEGS